MSPHLPVRARSALPAGGPSADGPGTAAGGPAAGGLFEDQLRLAALRSYQIMDTAREQAFDELVELAALGCDTPIALVGLMDGRRQWIKASVGLQLESVAVHDTFCAHVVASGQSLVVPDALGDSRFARLPLVSGPPGVRFYAGVPLTAPSGQTVGTLSVLDVVPRTLGDTARGILERLAHRVVDQLELRARTRDLELERQLLASNGEVLSMINSGSGLPEVLAAVARSVERQDPEVICSILLIEEGRLRDGAGPSLPRFYRDAIDGVAIGPSVGSCGTAAYTRQRVVCSDIAVDRRWDGYREVALPAGLRACWSSPILDHAGDVLGTFAVYFRTPRVPEERHWELIQRWTDLAGVAIIRTRAQEQIRRMALTDPLTGLPNRAGLQAAYVSAQQALTVAGVGSHRGRAGLLLMDLDRFKVVNDSLGHAVGDEYLATVARRLAREAEHEALVSRFGGDEFVILLSPTARERAESLGRRLVEVVRRPVLVQGRQIVLSASIGIALAESTDPDLTPVLRNADAALYQAKGGGRDRVVVFDAGMHEHAVRVLELEAALRAAIERQQLSLAFQPNIDLAGGHVVGVEVLARWNHPSRGEIPPLQFIPVAEESGLILALGRWVLRQALEAFAARRRSDPTWQDVIVWVNVSAAELNPDLVSSLAGAVEESGVPPDRVGLEVTESSLMADLPMARSVLLQLRALGVQLAIDDFGTGYSSLSQLKHLPVHVLKIDRSFVSGLGHDRIDEGVVQAVLALAEAHGLRVVAEGIETSAQRDLLRALGCAHGQGYLFGRPGPLEAVGPGRREPVAPPPPAPA